MVTFYRCDRSLYNGYIENFFRNVAVKHEIRSTLTRVMIKKIKCLVFRDTVYKSICYEVRSSLYDIFIPLHEFIFWLKSNYNFPSNPSNTPLLQPFQCKRPSAVEMSEIASPALGTSAYNTEMFYDNVISGTLITWV